MFNKKKTKKITEKQLLNFTIKNGIDLWLFKQCIIDMKKDYEWYLKYWRELSRVKLEKTEFNNLIDLLERYMKKND